MAPASTTPAARSSGRISRVRSSDSRAACSAALATRAAPSVPVSPPLVSEAAVAASSRTDSMVPSFGAATARLASAAAPASAAARPVPDAPFGGRRSNAARSTCDRITPEFRGPPAARLARSPRPRGRGSRPRARPPSASTTARCVCSRFVPVSPSGTGKTFSESSSGRNRSRACAYSAIARTSVGASRVAATKTAGQGHFADYSIASRQAGPTRTKRAGAVAAAPDLVPRVVLR